MCVRQTGVSSVPSLNGEQSGSIAAGQVRAGDTDHTGVGVRVAWPRHQDSARGSRRHPRHVRVLYIRRALPAL